MLNQKSAEVIVVASSEGPNINDVSRGDYSHDWQELRLTLSEASPLQHKGGQNLRGAVDSRSKRS